MIFIVAALLFYQSHAAEGFINYPGTVQKLENAWATWNPSKPPIAGRLYDPNTNDPYPVPADLIKAPISQPYGSIPLSQQRPNMTPGTGTTTAPKEAMAQIKDLRELDNKITLWLDAASQKEREQPGSLTSHQLQRRVMLQARLSDVRDQMGTGMITDSWKRVADELMELRKENAGWQERSPSLDEVYDFGKDQNPHAFLTDGDYVKFYGLFNAAVQEMQELTQPDPLQKVRLQQLQIMRQDLIDTSKKVGTPPIKMGQAQLYLRQMLRPDQPLPTLFSMEPPPMEKTLADSPLDVIADLQDIRWKLTVNYDPAAQDLKRATATLLDRLNSGAMSAQEARQHVASMRVQTAPSAFGSMPANQAKPAYDPKNLVKRANVLCERIGDAFPDDAEALGCQKYVKDNFEAETVINTVCARLHYSVPTVTPEQFGCPKRNV
jgi:hypothetical protein